MSKCSQPRPLLKHAFVSSRTGSGDCILMATAEVVLVAGFLIGLAPKGSFLIVKTHCLKMALVKSICYDVKVSLNTVPEKRRWYCWNAMFISCKDGLTFMFVNGYAGKGSFKAELWSLSHILMQMPGDSVYTFFQHYPGNTEFRYIVEHFILVCILFTMGLMAGNQNLGQGT